MNRIDQKFKEDKKLLSIYFSAGYPSLEDTVPILKNLQASGVDMVEIGLPFSDPLAVKNYLRSWKTSVNKFIFHWS